MNVFLSAPTLICYTTFLERTFKKKRSGTLFEVSPDAVSFFTKVSRGDSVIWQTNLRLLTCFGSEFSGNWDAVAGGRFYQMYEPYFWKSELNLPLLERQVVGLQFYSAHAQLVMRPNLQCTDTQGGISVHAILEDSIAYLREKNLMKDEWEEMATRLLRFTQTEQLHVPSKIVLEMINSANPTRN